MEKGIIEDTFHLIKKDFELQLNGQVELKEQLLAMLLPIIQHMLNREFERLLQICYRIDLDENKLKYILNESDPEQMAVELAEAIINRQIKKVEIRRKYSQS
ncbi:hypothetical protein MM236_18415 [Belliella sp. DSM 107340]|uniref:Uncharacterized protein n=1 Tax=Belliella calami TaxID=2923436 RepID=A0ABS9UU83_9BACT|nr:hypothetical protein [Belliella calami]MCH7399975.1 hypothetical protein [Belliella calami]